jgi:hypothetical protein
MPEPSRQTFDSESEASDETISVVGGVQMLNTARGINRQEPQIFALREFACAETGHGQAEIVKILTADFRLSDQDMKLGARGGDPVVRTSSQGTDPRLTGR